MATWLYPISKRAGRDFCLDDGTRCKVSFDNYTKLVRDGLLGKDEEWSVSANFQKARTGEEVYIYTGDEDRGIIVYAKIREVDRLDRVFHLEFDLKKCKALLAEPIPASHVRQWVLPRRAVVNLTPHLSKLNSLLPWKGLVRNESEQNTQTTGGAGFGVDLERNKEVEIAAIKAATRYYRKKGWSVDPTYQTKGLGFDLLCSKGSLEEKVEVKGIFGQDVRFVMTAGERKMSKDQSFVLLVVCNALSKPLIKTWTAKEMEKYFEFAEISYVVSLKDCMNFK